MAASTQPGFLIATKSLVSIMHPPPPIFHTNSSIPLPKRMLTGHLVSSEKQFKSKPSQRGNGQGSQLECQQRRFKRRCETRVWRTHAHTQLAGYHSCRIIAFTPCSPIICFAGRLSGTRQSDGQKSTLRHNPHLHHVLAETLSHTLLWSLSVFQSLFPVDPECGSLSLEWKA